jgi:hypothetical protein
LEENVIEESKICSWETLMKKALIIFSTLLLVVFSLGDSLAENKSSKLISVKPAYEQAAAVPQNSSPATNIDTQYPDPSPRDQMYIFWLFGKIISYPIDKVESYVTKKLYSPEKPKFVPATAPASASSPFDSINWREIPPAPPVQSKNAHNR